MNYDNDCLALLQAWYLSQCDGEWEHEFGIKIDTLDNPGWTIEIDLIDTELEDVEFIEVDKQFSRDNWLQCEVKEGKFLAACGPCNLNEMINVFLDWSKASSSDLK